MVGDNRHGEADVDPLPSRYTTPRSSARSTTPRACDAPSTDALLAKKYVDLDEHKAKVRAGKYDELTAEETRALFGSTTLPIFVPLARNESMRQYEQRFEDWLRRERAMTLRDLASERLRPLERKLRIRFAELNVSGVERFDGSESPRAEASRKRERRSPDRSRSRERGTKRPAPEVRFESHTKPSRSSETHRQESVKASKSSSSDRATSSQKLEKDTGTRHGSSQKQSESRDGSAKTEAQKTHSARDAPEKGGNNQERSHSKMPESQACRVKLPASKTATVAETVAAYVACACHACLMQAVSHMATRVCDLEKRVDEDCGCKAHQTTLTETVKPVADITRDDDRQSPAEPKTTTEPTADAITRLVRSRSSTEKLVAQTTSSRSEKANKLDDPIEQQLAEAYDLVNQRIDRNEKTLEVSSARLTSSATSAADVEELASLHDEKDELVALIQRDSEKRVAALAALAVYLWRNERAELQKMASDQSASNVPHVQAAGHRKCAKVATEIAAKREYASKIRRQLDAALQHEDGSSESRRLAVLQKLGELLTQSERELLELLTQRRRALATVIHFDARVRTAILAKLSPPQA